jgi:hypothetical protein
VEYNAGAFFKRKGLTQDAILANDGRVNLPHSSGRKAKPCGNIGVHPHTPLPLTTPTSLAPAFDRQHNIAWKWRTHTLVLALDRRIFDIPLEERLQSRTTDLVAGTKTIFPVIHHSISEARAQIRTGHTASVIVSLTRQRQRQNQPRRRCPTPRQHRPFTTVRTNSRLLTAQQRLQYARTQAATISRNICQYFPGRSSASSVSTYLARQTGHRAGVTLAAGLGRTFPKREDAARFEIKFCYYCLLSSCNEQQTIFKMDKSVFIDALFLTFRYPVASFVEFFVGKIRESAPETSLHHGLPPFQENCAGIRLYGMLNVRESCLF